MVGIDQKTDAYLSPGDIAQLLQVHPSAPVRWCRKGVVLSDDTKLYPEFVCTPGGYRIKRSALDAFLEAIKADRAGTPDETPAPKPAPKSERVAAMNARLSAAGMI
jgi:hypothetical protein